MPLKLVPPRRGNPNYAIRGSYLQVKRYYRSTGTPEKRVAERILAKVKRDIESGALAPQGVPTFASAMTSYIQAGGEQRFLTKIADHMGDLPLDRVTQAKVDAAADALYPNASPATRNRQVYSPVSAILQHAGITKGLNRPKGARGKVRTAFLTPEEAFRFLDAAEASHARFGALCVFYLYTGCRLSEALRLEWADVDLAGNHALIRETKNGDPRPAFLPDSVVTALANIPLPPAKNGEEPKRDGRVFRFAKSGALYDLFRDTAKAAGVTIPERVAFHLFRHSFGAWMRRYGGLDTSGLVATKAWKSREAAAVYEHVETSEEARKAALLPTRKRV